MRIGPRARLAIRRAVLVIVLCGVAGSAAAQVETQILDLNSEALDAYHNLDIDTASAKLQEALAIAEQAGYAGPEVAQTLVNLGVVFVAGYSDPDQGLASFVSALCLQPDVQLDPLLSTPDVQQVFLQAQADAQAGACGAPQGPMAPAQPVPQQQYMPGPQPGPTVSGALDRECPPGMTCDSDWGGEEDDSPGEFARFFVNLQFALGFAMVQSGMETDAGPPDLSEVFMPPMQVPIDDNMDGMQDVDNMGNPLFETIELFNVDSAWVPDADSFDDALTDEGIFTPVSTECEADGERTGPTDRNDPITNQRFTTIEPSRYCARVETPGFVMNPALRANFGYWITDSFALSLPFRFQFDAGEGSLSHILLGLRGELMLNSVEGATGFPVSWFFGGTYGQIQAKPPPKAENRPAPYVISGPVGLHTGVAVRFRVHRNFGFIIAPEFDLMVPDFLINADASFGVEGAF